MLKYGGKFVVASYVTAPEKGCGSPSNALQELEEFLQCHNGVKVCMIGIVRMALKC
jgi:hypothetical protein